MSELAKMTEASQERRLRIYYESIEQALHLVLPLCRKGLMHQKESLPIELVRANWPPNVFRGPIDAFRLLNTPDILVSVVIEKQAKKIEFPLFAVEFSEAVKTEDHELQRATVPAASIWSGIPVVKLSGESTSTASHGGNVEFDPLVLAKLFRDSGGLDRYFYQEWPSENGRLLRQRDALSCPPLDKIPVLEAVITSACKIALSSKTGKFSFEAAIKDLISDAEKNQAIISYRNKVSASKANPGSMVSRLLETTPEVVNPDLPIRDRVIVGDDNTLFVKINRFNHAGDPDRGVLIALSTAWSGKVKIFYRMERRGKTLSNPKLNVIHRRSKGVSEAFWGYSKEEGLPDWLCNTILEKGRPKVTKDISAIILANAEQCKRNTLLRAIFMFSDGMLVQFSRGAENQWMELQWDRNQLSKELGPVEPKTAQVPRNIVPATEPDEDEVTYVAVHDVLRPNGFKILAVSYPGHQGSGAILRDEEHGRVRTRTYADIVAVAPCRGIVPSLTEAKEKINSGVNDDIEKLNLFRRDASLRQGLNALLELKEVFGWDKNKVLLSIAFGESRPARWTPTGIDFIVRLNGREMFSVAPFGNHAAFFPVLLEGATTLPEVFNQE